MEYYIGELHNGRLKKSKQRKCTEDIQEILQKENFNQIALLFKQIPSEFQIGYIKNNPFYRVVRKSKSNGFEYVYIMNNLFFEKIVIRIQSWYRGCHYRLIRLPLIMYKVQKYLTDISLELSISSRDGRINSCVDEDKIIDLLIENFGDKIKISRIRMWYDLLIKDYLVGWIPVNIKITTTLTSDNTGNLAMCVQAYTDELLDTNKAYNNCRMANVLFKKLKEGSFNRWTKKDYYFLVINKSNSKDIIVNSVRGLEVLTSNTNNLPFQICWSKNKSFKYGNINEKIHLFVKCLKRCKPSWRENFMENMRELDI
jgi:hypothetical protein